jgi:hypothetical protein
MAHDLDFPLFWLFLRKPEKWTWWIFSPNFESCQSVWHDFSPWWHRSCHIDSVTPAGLARLMHKSHQLKWRDSVMPNQLAWLLRIKGHRHFFLFLSSFLLSSVAVAPLAIVEFLAPYESRGALNHLHELVSQSYWYVCHFYRPIWLYFEFFVWINSCGRVSKLIQCICN